MRPWAAVCRMGGIGDNLMTASVLPLLAETYNVEVISQEPCSCIFENNPHIDKLSVKEKADFPQDALGWQQWFATRGKEYDKLVNLSHSCESMLAMLETQTQFYWPQPWRRKWCNHNYVEFVHDIVGVPHKFGHRLFYPTEEEWKKAEQTKEKIGGFVLGWVLSGSRIDKIYPFSAMAIARLIRELNASVIMFGAPGKEFEMAKQVMEHVERQNGTHEGLHLALSPDSDKPSWPIRRSLAQVMTCDLVIGPDTGLMWTVAFENMPKIMLHSHASVKNIVAHWKNTLSLHASQSRVPCWPCHQLHNRVETCRPNKDNTGAACISDITVEDIVSTASRLMNESTYCVEC